MDTLLRHSELAPIAAKLDAQERLSAEDGRLLFSNPNLALVGRLADRARRRLHGRIAWFVRNRHINYTNYCDKTCLFCAFQRTLDSGPEYGGYVLSMDQVRKRLAEPGGEHLREVHVVGGVNPDLPYDYYLDLMHTIREARPGIHIKAFTMVEIDEMARVSGRSHRQVLGDLQAAGLNTMPGGGAEIFSSRLHRKLFHDKIGANAWLSIARCAHELGIKTNATMLYGHVETVEERVEHLIALRELQDRTEGFQAFVPLSFHPDNTPMRKLPKPTAADDLRVIAVSRLLLDNIPHIKAYWIMISRAVAQIALSFGADDVDGTVVEEQIYHDAGADTPEGMTVRELVRLIHDAGCEPVERDALYQELKSDFHDLIEFRPAKTRRAIWSDAMNGSTS
ncbi:MAG: aminofutalosine synthase MqnE [Gemmatimonadetes bacterium]|nr:aminofutalosine synthase MqnE [Gemmatimonadota bacterium]